MRLCHDEQYSITCTMDNKQGSPQNGNIPAVSDNAALTTAQRIACWCVCSNDGTRQTVVRVALPPSLVANALSRRVKPSFWAEYRGRVSASRFTISVGHPFFHNSFWPIMYGRIDDDSGGSKITAHFDISAVTKILMVLALCISLVVATICLFLL